MKHCKLIAFTIFLLCAFSISANAVIHEIEVGSFFFAPVGPDPTVINHGDTVRWTFVGGFHTSTADGTSPVFWDSGLMSSGSFERQFTAADGFGPFPYHCTPHSATMFDTIYIAPPAPEPQTFVFIIDQGQANAGLGTGSTASGYGVFTLSADSTTLSMEVEHDLAGATSAHVHNAPAGINGGIAYGFASPVSPISEVWAVTPTDVADLFAGNFYVNIHSAAFPGGEIRGQVVQEPIAMMFTLDEARANAGAGTGSHHGGFVNAVLNGDGSSFDFEVQHDIPFDSVFSGDIHEGVAGVAGGVAYHLPSSVSPITDSWPLGPGMETEILTLLRGGYYMNFHTLENPGDDIRGQVDRESVRWAFRMTEAEANAGAGTGSAATGIAVLELNDNYDQLSIYAEHDVINTTDGHLHLGGIGVNGPIQFGLASAVSPISETWNLSLADVNNLASGQLYLNIHSTDFPAGEIRGQIDIEPILFSVPMDEAQIDSCRGSGSTATGNTDINLNAGGKHLTFHQTHNVPTAFISNIHTGFRCTWGMPLYDFTTTISPDYWENWYLSNANLITLMRGELYIVIHSTAFFEGEIRGQLDAHITDGCCDLPGDANDDGAVDITDLTYTVDFMFAGGPFPVCESEGDFNGDGATDITDLTARVDFMFAGGPAPICGPE
ncbi:MAG: CHRD domain-containing protein [bacterium]|nr:CHRD domain-containing protein [bacterium]